MKEDVYYKGMPIYAAYARHFPSCYRIRSDQEP